MQPCRSAVPTQSVPVSPPPMTITSLSLAEMYLPSACSLSSRLLVLACRNSMAKWMPLRFRPSVLAKKSLGLRRPAAQHDGVELVAQLARPGSPCRPRSW